MYLLDTDVLIWLLRGKQDITSKISALSQKHTLALSVISIAEIYKNIFPSEITNTQDLIDQHEILNVDPKTAKAAGFYWQQHSKELVGLSLTDCLIAATANINGATLLTYNTKHFPMADIQIKSPNQL